MAHHGGDIGHFHSFLASIPSHKLGVVVLANTESSAGVVIDIAKSALNLMLNEKSPVSSLAQTKQDAPETLILNPYTLPGYYASEIFGLIRIYEHRGRMLINSDGKTYPLSLQPDGSAKAKVAMLGGEVKLNRDEISNRQVLIVDNQAIGRQILGEKLVNPSLSKVWRQRVGRYQISNKQKDVELPSNVDLKINNGFLIALGGRVLIPLNDQEAIIAGLGRGRGETITFESHGKQQTMRYMGLVAKRK